MILLSSDELTEMMLVAADHGTSSSPVLTVFLEKRASGSVSGLAFHIGSGTRRLRLKVCRLEKEQNVTYITA